MNSAIHTLRNLGSFTDADLTQIEQMLRTSKYQKGSEILKTGEVCRSIYFIITGSVRQTQEIDGTELTINLVTENTWFFDQKSFVEQKVSETSLVCFEDSEICSLTVHAIHELIAESQVFFQLGKLFQIAAGKHGNDFYLLSPEDRYTRLLATNPRVIQKFPLRYIASYLQITPETLSRVRKRIAVGELS